MLFDPSTLTGSLTLPFWSWCILCAIVILVTLRFRQAFVQRRHQLDLIRAEEHPAASLSETPIVDYASSKLSLRQRCSVADVVYLILVIACYLLAGIAQSIMPGGYSWGYDWELANFLMTIAALSSAILFIVGFLIIFVVGRRRIAIPVFVGTLVAGILPILMFFFCNRWLQGNFA